MAYEYYEKLLRHTKECYSKGLITDKKLLKQLDEVYRKAKKLDRLYETLIDENMYNRLFDNEIYKLLRPTNKSDKRIIIEVVQLFLDRLEANDEV